MRGEQEPSSNAGAATRDFLIQNWQTDEGLPRNNVNSIVQDQRGYLWFGTPHGLIQFDGIQFVAREGDVSPEFAQSFVQSLHCDRGGDLWMATRRFGLFRRRNGLITKVSPEWPTLAVDSVAEDAKGVIWATDGNGGLGRFQDGKFVKTAELAQIATGPMLFNLTVDSAGGLWFFKQDTFGRVIDGQPTNYTRLPGRVITLAPSRDGGMWVSTGEDVRRLRAGETQTTQVVRRLDFGPYGVTVMREDRSGSLWIGTTREGMFRLRNNTLEKVYGVHHKINDILEDAEGNIWVGTDGAGLFKIRPRLFHVLGEAAGLPPETILSVCGDWVAPRGGGLGRIGPSGVVEMLPEHEKNSLTSLMEDGAGGVWLGTAGSRLIHRSAGGALDRTLTIWPAGTQVRVLHRDQEGNLWIGGFPSGLFLSPAGNQESWQNLESRGFPKAAVTAIAEDAAGAIWIGTGAGELYCHTNGTFRRFGASNGFSGFPIGALLPATNGTLWVGTLGGGLGRFQNGQVKFLLRSQGLVDDVVSQLIEDNSGWLWIGGSRGISRARVGELEAVLEDRLRQVSLLCYGRSDGLANVQCAAGSQPSVWQTPGGVLRFATSRGVVAFEPATLPMNMRPPPLVLENVLVDGVAVQAQSKVQLVHRFKKLEFRYTALSFVAPEKVLFRRQLVGFDEGWIEDGSARSAAYPRLPPGGYAFQFTACNNDGVWNDEVCSLRFEVLPAFWQTLWFRIGMAAAFAGFVGGGVLTGVRVRMRRQVARLEQANALERERARISRDLHDDLGARLTQMALLTDLAAEDPATSPNLKGQIKDVSGLARNAVQSLDETVWMINPQKDTLAHVIGYVARHAEQFFESTTIHCRQEICRQPPECIMPGKLRRDIFMLVKEALNNVLKHSQASEVWLRIAVRGPLMRITVKDNGRGFALPAPATRRHGLENMRGRAESAGIKLAIRSQPGQGTRIAICVPLPGFGMAGRSRFSERGLDAAT